MSEVKLTIGGKEYCYEAGTSFLKIAKDFEKESKSGIALVSENGKYRELKKCAEKDAQID